MTSLDKSTPSRLSWADTAMLFPRLWASGPITPYEVNTLCGTDSKNRNVTHCAIGVPRGVADVRKNLLALDPDEGQALALAAPDTAWAMCMHFDDESTSDEPFGYICFTPTVSTLENVINSLDLVIHVAWIDPVFRSKGYGRHLAANFARYLGRHGPPLPEKQRRRDRPTTDITIGMPRPDDRAELLSAYIHNGLLSRNCPRWNPRKITWTE